MLKRTIPCTKSYHGEQHFYILVLIYYIKLFRFPYFKIQIEHKKLQWNVSSKVGSLDNASHKPKGGEKKIETIKLDFKDKAKPKVGSKDNIKHQPGGGDVKVNI